MIFLLSNQAYLFLIFALIGCIIGLLFDFFRILRKNFQTPNFITQIEDIFFWIFTGLIVLYSIFIFNNGEIRFFIFLGIFLGIMMYMLLISEYIITFFSKIIKIIKTIVSKIIKIINKLTKNILNIKKSIKNSEKRRILRIKGE